MRLLKNLVFILIIGIFISCSEDIEDSYPCLDGDCNSFFEIDPLVSPGVYKDNNGYWHVKFYGPNYFTIKGNLDQLHPDYIINNTPLVETIFDSNYWVWVNDIQFTVPLYNVLSYFTDGGYQTPISIGDLEYTLEDMAKIHSPLNIVGYQINKNQCLDCPYSSTLIGTYSKYTYKPKQQIFLDNEMVGDTAKVFISTKFNSDKGLRVVVEKEFKIIFE